MTKYESVFNYKLSIRAGTQQGKKPDQSMEWRLEQTISRQSPDDINFFTLPASFSKQLIHQESFYH